MTSRIFSSLLNSLTANGVAPSAIAEAVASVGSAFNSTASQVQSKLAALASLSANPAAYNAAAPQIISEVEGLVASKYSQTVPLLEKLRSATDPLTIAQAIAAIEQEI